MAGLATSQSAFAQEVIQNTQDQNAAISATQTLNVIENDGLTQATGQARGNELNGGNADVDATLTSVQNLRGTVRGMATINGINTGAENLSLGTPLSATTEAIGNYSGMVTTNGHMTSTIHQDSTAADVSTVTDVNAPNNAIYISGEGTATTEVNHAAFEVTNGRLDSQAWQSSTSDAKSNVSATVHYSPSPNQYSASSTQNYYGSLSDSQGSQEHEVHQTQSGVTQARAEVFAGNVWDTAAVSTAVANNNDTQNTGGSLVVTNDQHQTGNVQSQAYMSADEYGTAGATATGIGNKLAAGENDVYLRLDNTQISDGGVDVTSVFEGNNGFDSFISAEAYGNQALAYACAACQADIGVNSTQTNNGDVTATSIVNQTGQSRSFVSSAKAVGNSATYFVSGGQ